MSRRRSSGTIAGTRRLLHPPGTSPGHLRGPFLSVSSQRPTGRVARVGARVRSEGLMPGRPAPPSLLHGGAAVAAGDALAADVAFGDHPVHSVVLAVVVAVVAA